MCLGGWVWKQVGKGVVHIKHIHYPPHFVSSFSSPVHVTNIFSLNFRNSLPMASTCPLLTLLIHSSLSSICSSLQSIHFTTSYSWLKLFRGISNAVRITSYFFSGAYRTSPSVASASFQCSVILPSRSDPAKEWYCRSRTPCSLLRHKSSTSCWLSPSPHSCWLPIHSVFALKVSSLRCLQLLCLSSITSTIIIITTKSEPSPFRFFPSTYCSF